MLKGKCEYLVMPSDKNGPEASNSPIRPCLPSSQSLLKPRITRLLPCQQNYCHHRFPRRETAVKDRSARRQDPRKRKQSNEQATSPCPSSSSLSHCTISSPSSPSLLRPIQRLCVRACVLALPCLVVDPPSERAVGPCPFCSGPEKVVISK